MITLHLMCNIIQHLKKVHERVEGLITIQRPVKAVLFAFLHFTLEIMPLRRKDFIV